MEIEEKFIPIIIHNSNWSENSNVTIISEFLNFL